MNLQQLAHSFEPFRDGEGVFYIRIPKPDSDELVDLPLDTEEASDTIFWHLCEAHPNGRSNNAELQAVIRAFRGLARSRPPREPAGILLLAHKPLAKAVIAAARRGGTTKDDEALLGYLNRLALDEGIDTATGSPPWPKTVQGLGKQLGLLKPLLATSGISLIYHDTARPRKWTIPPLEAQKGTPGERDGEMAAPIPSQERSSGVPATSVSEETSDEEIMAQYNGENHA
jgi:hypothetical protein